jgi:hypothetical protein
MKTTIKKQRLIAILAALLITTSMMAQNDGYIKQVKKDFTVNPETRLEISNKYGNVDIVNRDDQAIAIEVKIKVNARDKSRADELLNMIDINIEQNGNVISAVTDIDKDFGRVFRGINLGNGGLEINYKVSMPKTVPLNLSNKYGNVFINELVSTSVLDIKYGKLTANKILHDSKEPLTKIFLAYSNAAVQETRWIELDIKYSKMNITESKALVILSKYSKLYIDNGSSIVCESKYDTYELGSLSNLVANAAYSHYEAKEVTDKLQLETKYTDVMVDRIHSGFESIKVSNSYGSYKLGIDPAASYRLDGYAKYCSINYPESKARVNRFNENNEMKVNGTIGDTENPKAEVSINSSYGNIRLVP